MLKPSLPVFLFGITFFGYAFSRVPDWKCTALFDSFCYLWQNPGIYQEAVHTVSLAARSRHVSNVVSSAQKQETPKEKIDMETKLQAWLESKGKTKSARRKEAFGSPFFLKSPNYINSVKKQAVSCSSVKAANRGVTGKDR